MPYPKINPSFPKAKLPGLHPKTLLDGEPENPPGSMINEGRFLLSGSLPEAAELCPVRDLPVAHELHRCLLKLHHTAAGWEPVHKVKHVIKYLYKSSL